MLGLSAHRLRPIKPEPRKVLVDRLLVRDAAAFAVDVLDAQ
jgi:hypothetical protein